MIYLVGAATPVPLAGPDGRGSEPFATDRVLKRFYRNKTQAERAAQDLAKKFPGEVFGVFVAGTLYEAKQPEIMEKVVNEAGEIVPKA